MNPITEVDLGKLVTEFGMEHPISLVIRKVVGSDVSDIETVNQRVAEFLNPRRLYGKKLYATDPEPRIGARVRDSMGRVWIRSDTVAGDSTYWINEGDDPESWIKVAGNYGPVIVIG